MIKPFGIDTNISKTVQVEKETSGDLVLKEQKTFYKTQFIVDGSSDITAMNAEGSNYLNYPAGSSVVFKDFSKFYVMNPAETAFEEVTI